MAKVPGMSFGGDSRDENGIACIIETMIRVVKMKTLALLSELLLN